MGVLSNGGFVCGILSVGVLSTWAFVHGDISTGGFVLWRFCPLTFLSMGFSPVEVLITLGLVREAFVHCRFCPGVFYRVGFLSTDIICGVLSVVFCPLGA